MYWYFRSPVITTASSHTLALKCYKNEHSFEICHWTLSSKLSCKISRRYDDPFSRKWRLKLPFLVVFRIFPNWNYHFRPGLWKAGCDVVRLYVLQSRRSCTFCKHKTRGETQFLIEPAALYTLTNHNEINSDDTLPFIIFLTTVSCDGSNRLWRQRLLYPPQTKFGGYIGITLSVCLSVCPSVCLSVCSSVCPSVCPE